MGRHPLRGSHDRVPPPTTRLKLPSVRRPRLRTWTPFLAIVAIPLAWMSTSAQQAEIIGSWRGTSLCVDKADFPSCHDEQVIYDVRPKGSSADTVTLRADKVVNGVREFMGEFDFGRQSDSTWVAKYENPRIHIRIVLRVRGSQMTGVMTDEPSARRIREIAVARVL